MPDFLHRSVVNLDGGLTRYNTNQQQQQRLWDRLTYSSASIGLFVGTVLLNGGLFGAAAGFSGGLSLGLIEFAAVKKLRLNHHLPALLREEEYDEEEDGGADANAKKTD